MDKKNIGLAGAASKEFIKDLTFVLTVEPKVLLELAPLVNTDSGFGVSDEDKVFALWGSTGLPPDDLLTVLGVVKFLHRRGAEDNISIDDMIDELADFVRTRAISGFDQRTQAFRQLLSRSSKYEKLRQLTPFALGVVGTLKSISGTIQLRAAFKDTGSPDIVGYVPIVQIRMTTETDDENKNDRTVDRMVFQLTEGGLRRLIKHLQEYDDELKSMKKDIGEKAMEYEELIGDDDASN